MSPRSHTDIPSQISPEKLHDYQDLSRSDPAGAISAINQRLEEDISPLDKIRLQNILAHTLWSLGQMAKAEKIYKISFGEASKFDLEEEMTDALVGLGMLENSSGNYASAAEKFTKSIQIYHEQKLLGKEAHVRNRYGINRVYVGDYEEGLKQLASSADLAAKTGEKHIELSARNNIALIQMTRGEIENAASQFKLCSEISLSIEFWRGVANTLSNYAEAIQNLGEYEEAEVIFKRAIEVAKRIQSLPSIGIIEAEMGGFYTEMGDLEKAKEHLDRSTAIFEKTDEPFTYVQCLNHYANFWLTNGNYHRSSEILQKALQIVEETNLSSRKIQLLLSLAQTNYALRNLDTSYHYIEEATKLAWDQKLDVGKGLTLLERARLNLAYSNYFESKLLLLEAQSIAEATHHFDMNFTALLLLAQTDIARSYHEQNAADLRETTNLVNQVVKIAKDKKLWPRYIDTLILQSVLYALKENIPTAIKKLKIALTQAKSRNMIGRIQEITRITALLDLMSQNPHNRSLVYRQIYNIITQEIDRMTTKGISFHFTAQDVQSVFITGYKMDEVQGTVFHAAENVDEISTDVLHELDVAASVYIMSLGQGQRYHQGLFGPFPFGGADSRALVFGTIKKDPGQESERNRGDIYFVACYVYPQRLSPLFNEREKLEGIFAEHFEKITLIREITPEFLKGIRSTIADYFLLPYLTQ